MAADAVVVALGLPGLVAADMVVADMVTADMVTVDLVAAGVASAGVAVAVGEDLVRADMAAENGVTAYLTVADRTKMTLQSLKMWILLSPK